MIIKFERGDGSIESAEIVYETIDQFGDEFIFAMTANKIIYEVTRFCGQWFEVPMVIPVAN